MGIDLFDFTFRLEIALGIQLIEERSSPSRPGWTWFVDKFTTVTEVVTLLKARFVQRRPHWNDAQIFQYGCLYERLATRFLSRFPRPLGPRVWTVFRGHQTRSVDVPLESEVALRLEHEISASIVELHAGDARFPGTRSRLSPQTVPSVPVTGRQLLKCLRGALWAQAHWSDCPPPILKLSPPRLLGRPTKVTSNVPPLEWRSRPPTRRNLQTIVVDVLVETLCVEHHECHPDAELMADLGADG